MSSAFHYQELGLCFWISNHHNCNSRNAYNAEVTSYLTVNELNILSADVDRVLHDDRVFPEAGVSGLMNVQRRFNAAVFPVLQSLAPVAVEWNERYINYAGT